MSLEKAARRVIDWAMSILPIPRQTRGDNSMSELLRRQAEVRSTLHAIRREMKVEDDFRRWSTQSRDP